MYDKLLILTLAATLVGCGNHGAPRTAGTNEASGVLPVTSATPGGAPAPSPVVSAEPALDPEPRAPRSVGPSALAEATVPVDSTALSQPYVIPAGTQVRVRLAETLDTKYTRPGGSFSATLDSPLVLGNRVVVPRGTPFTGAIVASKSSGRFRGRAVLELSLRSFRVNGVTYRVATAATTRVSGSHNKRNLAFMGGGPAAGAGVGAVAGGGFGALIGAGAGAVAGTTTAFITGKKNVRLPVETPMVFSLRSRVAVRRS